jgi:hypothetical protein
MFSWLTGATNAREDETFIDIPETPAPVFAVRAFKHALFGTPQAITPAPIAEDVDLGLSRRLTQRRARQPARKDLGRGKDRGGKNTAASAMNGAADLEFPPIEAEGLPLSPSKRGGILMTPGTVTGRRKQVKFGEQVVDNEGKKSRYSKSGLPDDCPGKFPSPWTPRTATPGQPKKNLPVLTESSPEKSTRVPLAKVLDVGKTAASQSSASTNGGRAADKNTPDILPETDDVDITMDLSIPRSTSGTYWKEQYDSYSSRSELETKKLIAKHKLAKEYARKKDQEATLLLERVEILEAQLDLKSKQEMQLKQQIADMRGLLEQAQAEPEKVSFKARSLAEGCESTGSDLPDRKRVTLAKSARPDDTIALTLSPLKRPRRVYEPMRESLIPSIDLWLEDEDDIGIPQRVSKKRNTEAEPRRTARTVPERMSSKAEGIPKPKALTDRSPNVISRRPHATHEKRSQSAATSGALSGSPKMMQAKDFGYFDVSLPLEELTLETLEPLTPTIPARKDLNLSVQTKTPRSAGGSKIDNKRFEAAKARLADRKRHRDKSTPSKVS